MLIDLSHRITDGMITYPGLPAPVIGTHLSREAAEELYGPGITFHIGLLTMCTNTGTYIDVPFHRYADGHDLADLALEQVAGLPAVVLDRRGIETIESRRTSFPGSRATPCSFAPTTPSTSAPIATSRAPASERLVRRCARRRRRLVRRHRLAEHRRHEDGRAAGAFDPPQGRDPIVEHLTNLAALPRRASSSRRCRRRSRALAPSPCGLSRRSDEDSGGDGFARGPYALTVIAETDAG